MMMIRVVCQTKSGGGVFLLEPIGMVDLKDGNSGIDFGNNKPLCDLK